MTFGNGGGTRLLLVEEDWLHNSREALPPEFTSAPCQTHLVFLISDGRQPEEAAEPLLVRLGWERVDVCTLPFSDGDGTKRAAARRDLAARLLGTAVSPATVCVCGLSDAAFVGSYLSIAKQADLEVVASNDDIAALFDEKTFGVVNYIVAHADVIWLYEGAEKQRALVSALAGKPGADVRILRPLGGMPATRILPTAPAFAGTSEDK